jgi:hypothetical protein
MNNSGFYWLGGSGEEEIPLNGKYEHEPEKELYFLVSVGPKRCDRRKMKAQVCPEMEEILKWIYEGLLNELSVVDDEFMAWLFAEKKPELPKKPLQHMLFQVVPSSAEMLLAAFGSIGVDEIANAFGLDYFRWEPLLLFPDEAVEWINLYFQHTELAHLMITRDFFEKHSDPDDEVTDPPVVFFSRSRSFTIALNG